MTERRTGDLIYGGGKHKICRRIKERRNNKDRRIQAPDNRKNKYERRTRERRIK